MGYDLFISPQFSEGTLIESLVVSNYGHAQAFTPSCSGTHSQAAQAAVEKKQGTHLLAWCHPPYQLMATSASSLTRESAAARLLPATVHTYSNRPGNRGQSYPVNVRECAWNILQDYSMSQTYPVHTPLSPPPLPPLLLAVHCESAERPGRQCCGMLAALVCLPLLAPQPCRIAW